MRNHVVEAFQNGCEPNTDFCPTIHYEKSGLFDDPCGSGKGNIAPEDAAYHAINDENYITVYAAHNLNLVSQGLSDMALTNNKLKELGLITRPIFFGEYDSNSGKKLEASSIYKRETSKKLDVLDKDGIEAWLKNPKGHLAIGNCYKSLPKLIKLFKKYGRKPSNTTIIADEFQHLWDNSDTSVSDDENIDRVSFKDMSEIAKVFPLTGTAPESNLHTFNESFGNNLDFMNRYRSFKDVYMNGIPCADGRRRYPIVPPKPIFLDVGDADLSDINVQTELIKETVRVERETTTSTCPQRLLVNYERNLRKMMALAERIADIIKDTVVYYTGSQYDNDGAFERVGEGKFYYDSNTKKLVKVPFNDTNELVQDIKNCSTPSVVFQIEKFYTGIDTPNFTSKIDLTLTESHIKEVQSNGRSSRTTPNDMFKKPGEKTEKKDFTWFIATNKFDLAEKKYSVTNLMENYYEVDDTYKFYINHMTYSESKGEFVKTKLEPIVFKDIKLKIQIIEYKDIKEKVEPMISKIIGRFGFFRRRFQKSWFVVLVNTKIKPGIDKIITDTINSKGYFGKAAKELSKTTYDKLNKKYHLNLKY